ncbi:MAG TPA: antitoxin [Dehalococcoidia bacterium]|nr:antitoxin [Dehalococcoidia bacterium]
MKTTLELPDDLMREIKVRAAREDRRLKDVVTELLRKGLAAQEMAANKPVHRVKLPIITGGHPAAPGEELTPERIHEILLQQEVDAFFEASQ